MSSIDRRNMAISVRDPHAGRVVRLGPSTGQLVPAPLRVAAALGAGVRSIVASVTQATGTVARGAASITMRWSARAAYGISVLLGRTSIDYAAEVGDPTKNSIVVAVVGWIARNFPEAPIRVFTEDEAGQRTYVRKGPTGPGAMLRLLERPNKYFSGVLLWMAVIVDLYTTGNAYILKVRNASGRVVELWWVPKRFIAPAWPVDGSAFISHYLYNVDGQIYALRPDDVVHLRDGIDPQNSRLGLSKLASLFREIYTDDEAANFSAQLLANLGVPGVVIAPSNTNPGGIKTDPEQVKRSFMEKFGGDKRGEPLVLTSPTDVKVLSFSPDEMNLRELRKIPEERISAVLGVSAIVAGLGAGLDRSTFTNYGEARQAAYEESVIPQQRLIAAELEVQLLSEFADIEAIEYDIDFDLRNVRALAEDVDAVWKRNESAATKGLLMRSQFLRAIGEQPAADGSDDCFVLPNNFTIMPAGGSSPPAGVPTPPKPPGPPQLPPGASSDREAGEFLVASAGLDGAAAAEVVARAAEAVELSDLRCGGCGRLLAEQITPPFRITCPRCKAVVETAA